MWAVALISFHLMVFWSMQVSFVHSVVLLALHFLLSPFLRAADPTRRLGVGQTRTSGA